MAEVQILSIWSNVLTDLSSKLGVQLANAIPPYVIPSSTGTSGSSSTSVSTGSSSTGSCAPSNNNSGSSNGATIGLGAALGVAVVTAAIIGFLLWRKTRKSQPTIAASDHPAPTYFINPKSDYASSAQVRTPAVRHKVAAEIRPAEMDGGTEQQK
ncbi:hypothetical protein N431DRAFT_446280 [Stipitochalara longipes BDJ]|nr:hypothetical protein N431DRAFT_446280 [Stipitochalara longipes BDJ]